MDRAFIVPYKEVKKSVAAVAAKCLCKLLGVRDEGRVADCDRVQRLEVMDNVQLTVLLQDGKPSRAV